MSKNLVREQDGILLCHTPTLTKGYPQRETLVKGLKNLSHYEIFGWTKGSETLHMTSEWLWEMFGVDFTDMWVTFFHSSAWLEIAWKNVA